MLTSFGMRFGVLGPANGDLAALEEGASLLLFERHADEVIYLGPDDALDRLVLDWAGRLVGDDPSQNGIWERAAKSCSSARHEEIDLSSPPNESATARGPEVPAGGHRRAPSKSSRGGLRCFSTTRRSSTKRTSCRPPLLVFGKSKEALVRQVGSGTFISPGEMVKGKAA